MRDNSLLRVICSEVDQGEGNVGVSIICQQDLNMNPIDSDLTKECRCKVPQKMQGHMEILKWQGEIFKFLTAYGYIC